MINLNLLNGLFLIHPILLVLLIVCILYKIQTIIIQITNKLLGRCYLVQLTKFKYIGVNLTLTLSTFLLLTGGWWAQQELNWGGYWVWDFIELVNLFLLSFYIYNKHIIHRCKYVYNFILQIICIFIILTIYIYSRYNLIPSVHTFLSDLCFLQYDFFIKLIIKLVFFYVIYYLYMYITNNILRKKTLAWL
jgi:cytochrome c biogenesis factor